MALTHKQRRFVAEYLKDSNATQAAIRCGYSPKTAKQQGSRLLTYADVRAAIGEKLEKVEAKTEDWLREVVRIARCDITQAFDKEGKLKPLHEIPEDIRRCIAGIEVQDHYAYGDNLIGRNTKLKWWSKTDALKLLGTHLGALVEKLEHSGSINLTFSVAPREPA